MCQHDRLQAVSPAKMLYPSSLEVGDMSRCQRTMHYVVAILLILVGFAAMSTAWFILLTTATHNINVVALELGGVAVCLAGYFLRKRCRRSDEGDPNQLNNK